MIKLILMTLFKSKLRIIYYLYFLIVFGVIFSLFSNYDSTYLKVIYYDDYLNEISGYILTIFKLLIPLTTFFLLIDHDQDYEKMIIPYLSRSYLYFVKVFVYITLIISIFIFKVVFIAVVNKLSGFTNIYNQLLIKQLTSLFLSNLIMLIIGLLLIRKKKQLITILLLTISILFNFIDVGLPEIIIYLYPISVIHIIDFKYTLIYQGIYLIFIIYLGYLKNNFEKIG